MTIYKTVNGKQIDMHKLILQNELTIAVGNMNVNARGDKIGPGGVIIKHSDDLYNNTVVNDNSRNIDNPQPVDNTAKIDKKTKNTGE